MSSNLSARIVSASDELATMAGDWNALAEGMPLRSYDWLATWWRHYGAPMDSSTNGAGERQLFLLVVASNRGTNTPRQGSCDASERIIGIAPWYIERVPLKGNVIRSLGSGEVCTDHLSILCQPSDLDEVTKSIAELLASDFTEWDQLELASTDANDPALARLLAQLQSQDCTSSRQPSDSCWILDLPSSWEEYLSELSKSHRKQLRQLERRVLDSDRTRWHRVQTIQDFDEAWPILVNLHQQRRRALNEPGCFASRQFHDFHRDVATRLLERGQLRLSWLDLDGSAAAAEYHLADECTTYAYQGGVDPTRLHDEPGRLSTILYLKAAIDEGHRHVDFLRGDEPYKAHWRATPRPTCNLRVVPNRRLARLRGHVFQLAESMTDWMKHSTQAMLTRS